MPPRGRNTPKVQNLGKNENDSNNEVVNVEEESELDEQPSVSPRGSSRGGRGGGRGGRGGRSNNNSTNNKRKRKANDVDGNESDGGEDTELDTSSAADEKDKNAKRGSDVRQTNAFTLLQSGNQSKKKRHLRGKDDDETETDDDILAGIEMKYGGGGGPQQQQAYDGPASRTRRRHEDDGDDDLQWALKMSAETHEKETALRERNARMSAEFIDDETEPDQSGEGVDAEVEEIDAGHHQSHLGTAPESLPPENRRKWWNPVGMENPIGANFCYFNATMQMLFRCTNFVEELESFLEDSDDDDGDEDEEQKSPKRGSPRLGAKKTPRCSTSSSTQKTLPKKMVELLGLRHEEERDHAEFDAKLKDFLRQEREFKARKREYDQNVAKLKKTLEAKKLQRKREKAIAKMKEQEKANAVNVDDDSSSDSESTVLAVEEEDEKKDEKEGDDAPSPSSAKKQPNPFNEAHSPKNNNNKLKEEEEDEKNQKMMKKQAPKPQAKKQQPGGNQSSPAALLDDLISSTEDDEEDDEHQIPPAPQFNLERPVPNYMKAWTVLETVYLFHHDYKTMQDLVRQNENRKSDVYKNSHALMERSCSRCRKAIENQQVKFKRGEMNDASEFYEFFLEILEKDMIELKKQEFLKARLLAGKQQQQNGGGENSKKKKAGAKRKRGAAADDDDSDDENDFKIDVSTLPTGGLVLNQTRTMLCTKHRCDNRNKEIHEPHTTNFARVLIHPIFQLVNGITGGKSTGVQPQNPQDLPPPFGQLVETTQEKTESGLCASCDNGLTVTTTVRKAPEHTMLVHFLWSEPPTKDLITELMTNILEEQFSADGVLRNAPQDVLKWAEEEEREALAAEGTNKVKKSQTTRKKKNAAEGDESSSQEMAIDGTTSSIASVPYTTAVIDSIVLFKGQHYTVVMRGPIDSPNHREWIHVNDLNVKVIGTSWGDVVHLCRQFNWAPLMACCSLNRTNELPPQQRRPVPPRSTAQAPTQVRVGKKQPVANNPYGTSRDPNATRQMRQPTIMESMLNHTGHQATRSIGNHTLPVQPQQQQQQPRPPQGRPSSGVSNVEQELAQKLETGGGHYNNNNAANVHPSATASGNSLQQNSDNQRLLMESFQIPVEDALFVLEHFNNNAETAMNRLFDCGQPAEKYVATLREQKKRSEAIAKQSSITWTRGADDDDGSAHDSRRKKGKYDGGENDQVYKEAAPRGSMDLLTAAATSGGNTRKPQPKTSRKTENQIAVDRSRRLEQENDVEHKAKTMFSNITFAMYLTNAMRDSEYYQTLLTRRGAQYFKKLTTKNGAQFKGYVIADEALVKHTVEYMAGIINSASPAAVGLANLLESNDRVATVFLIKSEFLRALEEDCDGKHWKDIKQSLLEGKFSYQNNRDMVEAARKAQQVAQGLNFGRRN